MGIIGGDEQPFGYHPIDWELLEGMNNHSDTIYIQNRHLLEKLPPAINKGNVTSLECRTKAGETIKIEIATTKFDSTKHRFTASQVGTCKNCITCVELIDGKKAFGTDCEKPHTEIKSMQIKWGDKMFAIPAAEYQNLYEPTLRDSVMEVYITNDQKLLYIYISGSDGTGAYSVKLVFNHTKYITRLVTTMEMYDQYEYLDQLPPLPHGDK